MIASEWGDKRRLINFEGEDNRVDEMRPQRQEKKEKKDGGEEPLAHSQSQATGSMAPETESERVSTSLWEETFPLKILPQSPWLSPNWLSIQKGLWSLYLPLMSVSEAKQNGRVTSLSSMSNDARKRPTYEAINERESVEK